MGRFRKRHWRPAAIVHPVRPWALSLVRRAKSFCPTCGSPSFRDIYGTAFHPFAAGFGAPFQIRA
jgi:hypothetical protein